MPPPHSEKGVKMFELAQLNVFTHDVKKGGWGPWRFIAHHWPTIGLRGMECVGRTWMWTMTWSEILGIWGLDPSAANRGAYAGLVHGIASRPKPKPKAPTTPATGGPPAATSLRPPGCLRQGIRGNLIGLDRQGTIM